MGLLPGQPQSVDILQDKDWATCYTEDPNAGQLLLTLHVYVKTGGLHDVVVTGNSFSCSPITGLAVISKSCSQSDRMDCNSLGMCRSFKQESQDGMALCHYRCHMNVMFNALEFMWNTKNMPNSSFCEILVA